MGEGVPLTHTLCEAVCVLQRDSLRCQRVAASLSALGGHPPTPLTPPLFNLPTLSLIAALSISFLRTERGLLLPPTFHIKAHIRAGHAV